MLNGHGDDAYQYDRPIRSNFSSNVYNRADLSGLKEHLATCLDSIITYPHPEAASLQQQIAKHHDVLPENICVTNGSAEAIYLMAQLFRGKRSGIWVPTFSEYKDACAIHCHQTTTIQKLDDLSRFELVWLCNPNNPTGRVCSKDFLAERIHRYPDVLFVIDQAYEWFTKIPVFSPKEALAFPNLIQLHSMTKQHAIPGLRLGFVVGQEEWIQQLRMQRMPWSVNTLAIAAGHYLLAHTPAQDLDVCLQEKEHLAELLRSIGQVDVLPSDTHFMLVRLRAGKACDLKHFLANGYGLLIRDASNFEGLDDSYIRIAAQARSENELLVDAIREWYNH